MYVRGLLPYPLGNLRGEHKCASQKVQSCCEKSKSSESGEDFVIYDVYKVAEKKNLCLESASLEIHTVRGRTVGKCQFLLV